MSALERSSLTVIRKRSLLTTDSAENRFDQMFFVDIPNQTEREAIWNILVRKQGRNSHPRSVLTDIPNFLAASLRAFLNSRRRFII